MMGAMNKNNEKMTITINGGGPIGTILATTHSDGKIKAFVANPEVHYTYNDTGKLAVGVAVEQLAAGIVEGKEDGVAQVGRRAAAGHIAPGPDDGFAAQIHIYFRAVLCREGFALNVHCFPGVPVDGQRKLNFLAAFRYVAFVQQCQASLHFDVCQCCVQFPIVCIEIFPQDTVSRIPLV